MPLGRLSIGKAHRATYYGAEWTALGSAHRTTYDGAYKHAFWAAHWATDACPHQSAL